MMDTQSNPAARSDDVDDDTLVKAAHEALTRPDNFGYFGDLPLFESWGFTLGQSAASDCVERSNYRVALAALQETASASDGDQAQDSDASLYVQEVHVSDWLVGSADHLAVRVLADDSGEISAANLTHTFIKAVELAVSLKEGYPILDESDFSDLETEVQESQWGSWLGDVVLTAIAVRFSVDDVAELTLNDPTTEFDGWNTIDDLYADSNAEATRAAYYRHESTEWIADGTSYYNGRHTDVMRDLIGNLFVPRVEDIEQAHADALREEISRTDGPNQLNLI